MAIFDGAIFDAALFDASASSSGNGSLSATIDAFTLSSNSVLPIKGTLASTISAVTVSSASKLAIVGTMASTLAPVTSSSLAVLPIKATLSAEISPVTLISSASLEATAITASLAATIDPITLGSEGAGPSIVRLAEVNWPGTSIPRSQFKAMQRAALAQMIMDERAKAFTPKQIRKSVKRVVEQASADGLLSSQSIASATASIREAIVSTETLQSIIDRLLLIDQFVIQAQRRAMDDEDAAIMLLLAA